MCECTHYHFYFPQLGKCCPSIYLLSDFFCRCDWIAACPGQNPPNVPTLTSPIGGEYATGRYFAITWTEASPTDPDPGDQVWYEIQYTTDITAEAPVWEWVLIKDNGLAQRTVISEGTTSIIWDLGEVPDTSHAVVRIRAVDACENVSDWDTGDEFNITGGVC